MIADGPCMSYLFRRDSLQSLGAELGIRSSLGEVIVQGFTTCMEIVLFLFP